MQPVQGTPRFALCCIVLQAIGLFKRVRADVEKVRRDPLRLHKMLSPTAYCCVQGTTTNGRYLLPFRTGAFLAGAPVQPVILKYGQASTA